MLAVLRIVDIEGKSHGRLDRRYDARQRLDVSVRETTGWRNLGFDEVISGGSRWSKGAAQRPLVSTNEPGVCGRPGFTCEVLTMHRLFSFSAALGMIAILSFAATVSADTRARAPFSDDAVQVIESYRPLLDAVDHNTREGRERFAQLQDELVDELSQLATGARPFTKGQADCNTACSLANDAKASAAMAKIHADAAAASSDPDCNSVYTDDAQYFAGVASAYADFAQPYACGGPKNAATAKALLEDAERRANKAWTNAWFSFTGGCSESYDTAVEASDATVELHNAAFYASNCN